MILYRIVVCKLLYIMLISFVIFLSEKNNLYNCYCKIRQQVKFMLKNKWVRNVEHRSNYQLSFSSLMLFEKWRGKQKLIKN